MREWVRKAIRTPNPPIAGLPGGLNPTDVQQGSQLFNQQGCQNCHAGTLFSKSVKDYTSPPGAADIGNERTGTFTGNPVAAPYVAKFITDIGSFNLGVPGGNNPLGANIGGSEKTTSVLQANGASSVPFDALGFDYNGDGKGSGFTVPSLLGIDASPPYYHNGACETLACVLSNPKHRTANNTVPDVLGNPADQAKVVAFLRSIK
jgi:cytochrome c peroxidase